MRILCPLCGFGREVDETKIPARAQMATCPKCEHKFRFRVVDDLESEPLKPGAPAMQHTLPQPGIPEPGAGPDPMAAQRRAAQEAWKHLQGVKPDAATDETAQSGMTQNAPEQPRAEQGGFPTASPPSDSAPTDIGGPTQHPAAVSPEPERKAGAGSPVPFEDLPAHGFFGGLWGTIRMVLQTPTAFFSRMPVTGGMGRPLVFHLLLAEFMVFCQFLWGLSGLGAMSQYAGSPELMDVGMGMAGAGSLMLLVFYPLLLILRLLLMTGVIHALLKVLRSGQNGPEATFRVLSYAAAPLLVGVIPFIGPIIGGVWSIGLTIIGLKQAHRTSISTAAFAVLVPILMLLAAVLGMLQGGMLHAG